MVVGFSRGRCLSECCWFGCRCRGDAKSWVVLVESAAHTKSLSIEFHFEPSCAVVSQVASFVRSLLSLNTLVGCIYDLMSSSHLLAGLPCFPYPFCLVHIAAFQLNMSFCPAPFVVLGDHSCLLPISTALSQDPRRGSICCQQVVCFVSRSQDVVDPWLEFVVPFVVWHVVAGRVCCQRLGCFPSRVVLLLAVGVVGFIIADFVDVRGMCETCLCFFLLL